MNYSQNSKTKFRTLLGSALAAALFCAPSARAVQPADDQAFITLTRTPVEEKKLPTNVSVVRSEQIEKLGIQNAGDAIDYLSSINVQKNSGLGSSRLPKVRGFLNKQVAVFVDNRRVPPDVTGNVDLAQISAEQIDRIEILRGGASVLYGPNAEGGVIHIITKRPTAGRPMAAAEVLLKSYETEIVRGEGNYKKDRWEGSVSASKSRSNGFMKNSDFDNKSFAGNAGYDFARFGKTTVDFFVSRSENGNPGGTPFTPGQFNGEAERTPNSLTARQRDNNDTVSVQHQVTVAEFGEHGPLNLTTRISGWQTRRESVSTALAVTTSTVDSRSILTQLDFPFGFTMGFEYERTKIQSPFVRFPQSNTWGVFFQENFDWRWFTVIPGVRFDKTNEWGDTTNPRLTVVFRPIDRLKFSANAGSAFQAPTYSDFTDFDPVSGSAVARTTPGPNPEKSWHYDFGVEAQPADGLTVKTTVFRADIKDRLAFQSSGFGGTTVNLQDSYNQGVEAEISHQFQDWLYNSVNYTYTDSQGKGPGVSTDFVTLRFTPAHRVNVMSQVTIKPVQADLGSVVQYVSEQYTGNQTSGLKLPEYAVWNLYATKKISWLTFKVGVDNVLERRYAQNATAGFAPSPDLYFPQPGRSFWGSVGVKFN